MRFAIDATQFTQLAELFTRAPDITREELLTTMTDVDLLLQGELMQQLPAGAGGAAGLRGSIAREEQILGDQVLGLVSTDRPYAVYVETGTRPHAVGMIGIQALIDWVEAKLGVRGKEATGVAFAIAHKIRKVGTKPNPVWQRTLEQRTAAIVRKFDEAVIRIFARLNEVRT